MKKPYRYRGSEATCDEAVARPRDLNQKRHLEERVVGPEETGAKKKAPAKPAQGVLSKGPARPGSSASATKPPTKAQVRPSAASLPVGTQASLFDSPDDEA